MCSSSDSGVWTWRRGGDGEVRKGKGERVLEWVEGGRYRDRIAAGQSYRACEECAGKRLLRW